MTATPAVAGAAGLSPEDLGAVFRDRFGERLLDVEIAYGQLTVSLEPEVYVEAARMCKEDERLAFDFWEFCSGVDRMEEGFALVTGLYSTVHRHRVHLRILVPGGRDEPVAPSLTSVYRGANWSEREAYDMFGITFEGHPQLLPRILTVENFEGWPLRKEFLLMTREAKPWPGAKEPEDKAEAPGKGQAAASTASTIPASAEDKAAAAKAKAERAKAKAAAARARKAEERAAAQAGAAGAAAEEAAAAPAGGAPAEPEAEDERAAAPAAAGADVPAGTPDATTPEGAAEVAGSDIAKDAAAGAVGGDVAAGAPGDEAGTDEPVEDLEQEAKQGEGGAPTASGTPGIEVEGRHAGADEQSGTKPAAETPGMTPDEEEGERS